MQNEQKQMGVSSRGTVGPREYILFNRLIVRSFNRCNSLRLGTYGMIKIKLALFTGRLLPPYEAV